jgi:hypothetical protein
MPLRNMMAGNPTEAAGADAFETERQAKEQAENLLKARATLESIAKNAKAKDSFVASLNKNAGARDQNEFVKTFAETWVALNGSLPPTSTKMSPFLKLLYAAWEDANQDKGANFKRAILRARSDVKPFVPTLIQAGPDWLWYTDPTIRFEGVWVALTFPFIAIMFHLLIRLIRTLPAIAEK